MSLNSFQLLCTFWIMRCLVLNTRCGPITPVYEGPIASRPLWYFLCFLRCSFERRCLSLQAESGMASFPPPPPATPFCLILFPEWKSQFLSPSPSLSCLGSVVLTITLLLLLLFLFYASCLTYDLIHLFISLFLSFSWSNSAYFSSYSFILWASNNLCHSDCIHIHLLTMSTSFMLLWEKIPYSLTVI